MMKRTVFAFALVLLTAGMAFAGHIEVVHQDGSRDILTDPKPAAVVTVVLAEKFLKIDYKDGSNEVIYPDEGEVVTAVGIILDEDTASRMHVNYVGGQGEDFTASKPVSALYVIVSQHFLSVSYRDGTSESIKPNGEMSSVNVFID